MKTNVIFFINNVINKRSKIESTASFVSDRQSLTNTTFSTKIDLQNKRNPPEITLSFVDQVVYSWVRL
jgi:hypothetical protein